MAGARNPRGLQRNKESGYPLDSGWCSWKHAVGSALSPTRRPLPRLPAAGRGRPAQTRGSAPPSRHRASDLSQADTQYKELVAQMNTNNTDKNPRQRNSCSCFLLIRVHPCSSVANCASFRRLDRSTRQAKPSGCWHTQSISSSNDRPASVCLEPLFDRPAALATSALPPQTGDSRARERLGLNTHESPKTGKHPTLPILFRRRPSQGVIQRLRRLHQRALIGHRNGQNLDFAVIRQSKCLSIGR